MFRISPILRPAEKSDSEHLNLYTCTYQGLPVRIAVTKSRANRRVRVCCAERQLLWRHRIMRQPLIQNDYPLAMTDTLMKDVALAIVVVRGQPECIYGLDEGQFASAAQFEAGLCPGMIYVMSERAFHRVIKKENLHAPTGAKGMTI